MTKTERRLDAFNEQPSDIHDHAKLNTSTAPNEEPSDGFTVPTTGDAHPGAAAVQPRDGIRLEQFQMLNWGTFDRSVQRLKMFSGNTLLTGQIGAGKSTVVDGLTTLFADTSRVTFNLAAGADRRERNLATYVLGTYGRTRDEDTGTNKAETLRTTKTAYSVLLARFTGLPSRATSDTAAVDLRTPRQTGQLSAGVVFWFPENSLNPNKLYFTCPSHLDINEHLVGHRDHRAVRTALRDAGAELFENNYRSYQRSLCRQLNLSSNALKLLVQTISMKQVGNLTGFVREHMLDETTAPAEIAKILDHYADLLRAHELVQEARRQLEKLDALRRDADAYDRAITRIESSRDAEHAVQHRAEQLRATMLEEALAHVQSILPGLRANRDQLAEQVRQAAARFTQNEVAIATHGGAVLREAERELELAQENLQNVAAAAAELQSLAVTLDVAPLEGIADYPRFTSDVDNAATALAGGESAMRDQVFETERAFREANSILKRTQEDYQAAGIAASNVPRDQRQMRDRICAELSLPAADLPYAAELLTVAADAQEWELAAERLLRPFALALLVPPQHYERVATWVDASDLRGRLEYHPVPAGAPVPASVDMRTMASCIEVRPDTFATAWLTSEIARRYDHVRVDAAPDMRGHRRAVTRAGQTKDGSRHVKDDRRHLVGRSNYVLGWDTAVRREAIAAAIPGLEQAVTDAKNVADAAAIRQNQHGERIHAVRQIRERFSDLTAVDIGAAHDRVQQSEEMVASFASDADLAHFLKVKARLEGQMKDLDERRSLAENAVGAAEQTKTEHVAAVTRVQARLEHLSQPDLDDNATEALTEAIAEVPGPDSLDQIGSWQREVSAHLSSRAESARNTRERAGQRLVGHMKDFAKEWPLAVGEIITTDPSSRVDFLSMRDRLELDDLPRYEDNFRTELETNAIHHLARFSVGLEQESRKIAERIDVINNALHDINYRPGTYIKLVADPTTDAMVRDFRNQLEAITGDTMLGDDETYAEIRFLRVKELLNRFAGREGSTAADQSWTAKVTDVRNWFVFSGSERARLDDAEIEHYEDSGGKSGGQKEKLAYTVLAASLSYQYGLAGGRANAFRFVMIDEAFGRGSEESTKFGLELFSRLGLQLLTVTPLQKIQVIENYVDALAYVRPIDPRSQLISMPIEEYRAKRRRHGARAAGNDPYLPAENNSSQDRPAEGAP